MELNGYLENLVYESLRYEVITKSSETRSGSALNSSKWLESLNNGSSGIPI